jgi:hypothetical protein
MQNTSIAQALSPAVIDGVKFKVKRQRKFEWLIAKIDGKFYLLNYSNNDFFTGWAYSVTEETGRPIASSVGQNYYPTKEDAFDAARKI